MLAGDTQQIEVHEIEEAEEESLPVVDNPDIYSDDEDEDHILSDNEPAEH
jgi:hypothetical protein